MVVVEDESVFTYDVKITAVWAVKGSKPIVFSTGSKRKTVVFGTYAEDGSHLFRQYPNGDSDCFLEYIGVLHKKYPKMILFMDKASYHKKEKRVKKYLSKQKHSIKVRWFPSGFPEANLMEECWNQGKDSVLGSKFYDSFEEFRKAVSEYYRTKKFSLDVYKYLCH